MNYEKPPSWFDRNPKKTGWLIFFICFLFLEITCRILVAAGLLHHETYPTNERPVFWAYIDPVVGMWRYPNKKFHHRTDCIDAVYETNSAGARDPERSLRSDAARRVVVLGDSMIEGHGVNRGKRATDILEKRTNIEHLNFGTSGSFGTIQQWLYYREYGSKYDHSDVFLFLFPANDFNDNDIRAWKSSVYRPYLRKNGSSYDVYYPVEFENRAMNTQSASTIIKNSIDNNVYLFNALRWGLHVYKESNKEGRPLVDLNRTPTYEDYSPEDLEMMLFALNQIAEEAGNRNVHIFTIPVEHDAEAAIRRGTDFSLSRHLMEFAAARSNVEYTDLLPHMVDYMTAKDTHFRSFTLGCNLHWSELGNEVVADIVYKQVYAR